MSLHGITSLKLGHHSRNYTLLPGIMFITILNSLIKTRPWILLRVRILGGQLSRLWCLIFPNISVFSYCEFQTSFIRIFQNIGYWRDRTNLNWCSQSHLTVSGLGLSSSIVFSSRVLFSFSMISEAALLWTSSPPMTPPLKLIKSCLVLNQT